MNSWSSNYIVDKGGTVAGSAEGLWEHINDQDLSCIYDQALDQYRFLMLCMFQSLHSVLIA